jgi:hypothetical protein
VDTRVERLQGCIWYLNDGGKGSMHVMTVAWDGLVEEEWVSFLIVANSIISAR